MYVDKGTNRTIRLIALFLLGIYCIFLGLDSGIKDLILWGVILVVFPLIYFCLKLSSLGSSRKNSSESVEKLQHDMRESSYSTDRFYRSDNCYPPIDVQSQSKDDYYDNFRR